jgi:hypothetical protein
MPTKIAFPTAALNDPHSNLSEAAVVGLDQTIDVERWLAHFLHNRENRPEPGWDAPITIPSHIVKRLVKSIEQFELGDGGGPDKLIAWNADRFRCATTARQALVDLWFAEEKEHSRLLRGCVARFGGECIKRHWSFTAFCQTRRWLGVSFELTVLLLTEIVSTAYYRLLHRHGDDEALRAACKLILRDEAGHVAFHRDRLARATRRYGLAWELRFRILGYAAATMLWVNHHDGVCAIGGSTAEFYREVRRELSRFVRRLQSDTKDLAV